MFAIFRDVTYKLYLHHYLNHKVQQVELVSDIPEDGKPIMPKRAGYTRILIDGARFFKVFKVHL
jgi:hypothetical protein